MQRLARITTTYEPSADRLMAIAMLETGTLLDPDPERPLLKDGVPRGSPGQAPQAPAETAPRAKDRNRLG